MVELIREKDNWKNLYPKRMLLFLHLPFVFWIEAYHLQNLFCETISSNKI